MVVMLTLMMIMTMMMTNIRLIQIQLFTVNTHKNVRISVGHECQPKKQILTNFIVLIKICTLYNPLTYSPRLQVYDLPTTIITSGKSQLKAWNVGKN